MRWLFTCIILVILNAAVVCQHTDDFTVKDIEGNEFRLYEYLDQGTSVLFDFSTTWCAPCWELHLEKYLDRLHDIYGQDGTGQIKVVFVESDTTTTSDDLYGTGTNTYGDWVSGAEYTIIDLQGSDKDIISQFDVFTFAQFVFVSAKDSSFHHLTRFEGATFEDLVEDIYNHIDPITERDLHLDYLKFPRTACSEVSGKVGVFNPSSLAVNGLSVELKMNDVSLDTLRLDTILHPKEFMQFDLDDIPITDDQNKLEVSIIGEDFNTRNNTRNVSVSSQMFFPKIIVEIAADRYTIDDNTRFEISDSNGTIVFRSGALPADTMYRTEIELSRSDCYSLCLLDDAKNGLRLVNEISIKDAEDRLIFDGIFDKDRTCFSFEVQGSDNTVSVANPSSLFWPNPVEDIAYLTMGDPEGKVQCIEIINLVGQRLLVLDDIKKEHPIDMSSLDAGRYIMLVRYESYTEAHKFIRK